MLLPIFETGRQGCSIVTGIVQQRLAAESMIWTGEVVCRAKLLDVAVVIEIETARALHQRALQARWQPTLGPRTRRFDCRQNQ